MKVFLQIVSGVFIGLLTMCALSFFGADDFMQGLWVGTAMTCTVYTVGSYIEYKRS